MKTTFRLYWLGVFIVNALGLYVFKNYPSYFCALATCVMFLIVETLINRQENK